MRSSAAAAAQNLHMTPRSKSLFAFVGESTHAYRSPGRDLQFINRRINDAANADKAETDAAISAHTVAGGGRRRRRRRRAAGGAKIIRAHAGVRGGAQRAEGRGRGGREASEGPQEVTQSGARDVCRVRVIPRACR